MPKIMNYILWIAVPVLHEISMTSFSFARWCNGKVNIAVMVAQPAVGKLQPRLSLGENAMT